MNRLRYMVSWDTRMLWSSGYWIFSHPEICSGDQSNISLLATTFCNLTWIASRHRLGRKADSQAWEIGFIGSILRTASMTCDLPAHCRRNSIQASSDLANRRTGSEPSRDLLALTQREREERAPPDHRNKSTMTRHQTTNGGMLLAEGAPDLMQRVSRLPTAPHVALLRRRKPKPFPLGHKHHLW